MAALFEGDFQGKAIKAEFGTDKAGKPQVRATIQITTLGERHGVQVQYSGSFKPESIKYTKRDMIALGWQGKDVATFVDDVLDEAEEGKEFPFQVRVAEWTDPKTGKVKKWLAAGGIGYEAPPLNAPTRDMTDRVNSWFAEAEGESGDSRGNRNSDGDFGGYGNHPNAPGRTDDIPF